MIYYGLDDLVTYSLIILAFFIVMWAQVKINGAYKKYRRIGTKKKLSGQEIARKILDENGLKDIYVVEVKGELTDHYDPTRKVIRLSHDIFHGTSIASVSVAAHECGHAIQDKEGYSWMKIRSAIFPIVSISNKIAYVTLILGLIFQYSDLVLVSVILTTASLLFQLITLPVEFDASDRASKLLDELKLVDTDELEGTKKILKSAALTYVAGVLTTMLQMLYYLMLSRSKD